MRVTRLKLSNVRAIKDAEFTFLPGFNLIVGVNGVGKTTVLEAITRGLALAIEKCSKIPVSEPPLLLKDIRLGSLAATAILDIDLAGRTVQVQSQEIRNGTAISRPGDLLSEVDVDAHGLRRRGRLRKAQRQAQKTASVDSGQKFLPDEREFRVGAEAEKNPLLAVYFSTIRALPAGMTARHRPAVRAPVAAYLDAFTGRELRLTEFAEWIDVLQTTASEREDAAPMMASLDSAVRRFLPGYLRIRATSEKPKELRIYQSDQETLTANRLPLTDRQRLLKVLQSVAQHMSTNWPPEHFRGLSSRQLTEHATTERARVAQVQMSRFMDNFENLRGPLECLPDRILDKDLTGKLGNAFRIDRQARSLQVSQLSDGERGILALVLDLTRRLALANPGTSDPAAKAGAVVLIDELELHLHPKWQRSIINDLVRTFPLCQFIATTHSPQVIGEVRANHVMLMREDGSVLYPAQAFGMDSNWILRHIMEADDRNPSIRKEIDAALAAIRMGKLGKARSLVNKLRETTGETPDVAAARAKIDRAQELITGNAGKPAGRIKRNGGAT